ncbi:MAG: type IV pilus biogenesis/stability protein PilW [Pseudomonadota bacterium]
MRHLSGWVPGSRMATGWLAACLGLVMIVGCTTTTKRAPDQEIARVNTHLAMQYLQRGDFETAIEKLNKALAADSALVETHATAALIYDRVGKYDEAEDHYRQAIALTRPDSDDSASAYNNYGVFLCKRGKINDAADNFKRAFSNMFYNSPEVAYENAGVCLARQPGREGQAEAYLRKALELKPQLAMALQTLAQLQFEQKHFLQARAFIQRAHGAAAPTAASLWLAYRIERQLGDSKAAADLAQQLRNRYADTEQARQLAELRDR